MSTIAETAELVHGFTMADVDRLSAWASVRGGSMVHIGTAAVSERREAAWFAVVERLYESDEPPTRWELASIARNAASQASSDHKHTHGKTSTGEDAPNFAKFWRAPAGEDFEELIAIKFALPQVLAELNDIEYQAIAALAAHGNQQAAADALGLTYATFTQRVRRARAKIAVLWFAPETPRDIRQRKREGFCKYEHDLSVDGWVTSSGRLRCRACARNSHRRRRASGDPR